MDRGSHPGSREHKPGFLSGEAVGVGGISNRTTFRKHLILHGCGQSLNHRMAGSTGCSQLGPTVCYMFINSVDSQLRSKSPSEWTGLALSTAVERKEERVMDVNRQQSATPRTGHSDDTDKATVSLCGPARQGWVLTA